MAGLDWGSVWFDAEGQIHTATEVLQKTFNPLPIDSEIWKSTLFLRPTPETEIRVYAGSFSIGSYDVYIDKIPLQTAMFVLVKHDEQFSVGVGYRQYLTLDEWVECRDREKLDLYPDWAWDDDVTIRSVGKADGEYLWFLRDDKSQSEEIKIYDEIMPTYVGFGIELKTAFDDWLMELQEDKDIRYEWVSAVLASCASRTRKDEQVSKGE